VNVHGYQYSGGRRDLLRTAVANKSLWNSEYGESDGTGMDLASNLNLDFEQLRPTAWCYWQPLDSGGWGLIRSNPGDNWIGEVNPKYFVLAQYSRHIRPGMTIINGGSRNTIAAYDQLGKKLVIVTTNYGIAQSITHNLSDFSFIGGSIRRWTTQTGEGDKYVPRDDLNLSNKTLTAFFPANTVQTFEIPVAYQTGNPWTAWQTERFADNTTNPAIAGETADIDKDGNPNLLEYATGTDPLAFSSPPSIVTHDGLLSIRFTRNADAADVTLTVQGSNDLNVWTDVARSTGGNPLVAVANGVVVTETGTDRLRTVHASDANPSDGLRPSRRMLRLHVSK
jgi:hypothetical protein